MKKLTKKEAAALLGFVDTMDSMRLALRDEVNKSIRAVLCDFVDFADDMYEAAEKKGGLMPEVVELQLEKIAEELTKENAKALRKLFAKTEGESSE